MEGPFRETQQFPMARSRVRQNNCAGSLESWKPGILDACNRSSAAAAVCSRPPGRATRRVELTAPQNQRNHARGSSRQSDGFQIGVTGA